jgi:hypothetical protein
MMPKISWPQRVASDAMARSEAGAAMVIGCSSNRPSGFFPGVLRAARAHRGKLRTAPPKSLITYNTIFPVFMSHNLLPVKASQRRTLQGGQLKKRIELRHFAFCVAPSSNAAQQFKNPKLISWLAPADFRAVPNHYTPPSERPAGVDNLPGHH